MNIAIIDDHKIVRQGLRALLEKESDMIVVAEAEDGREAVLIAKERNPDVMLMDIALPILNGIEATRRIKAEFPKIEILALSMHSNKRYVTELLNAGGNGYLLKDCAAEELVLAIRTIVGGEIYLSPPIASMIVEKYVRTSGSQNGEYQVTHTIDLLSSREREILQSISEGQSTKQIAFDLGLSIKTIDSHKKQIMDKLKIYSVAELTKYAVREGITSI
jgi:DNA-binding NarL/FixJ family response regulator